jgi:hypothetical protein
MAVTRPFFYSGGVPGGSATVTLFDTGAIQANATAQQMTKDMRRVRLVVFADQAATFFIKWAAPGSANLRTMNGPATPPAGETMAASVPFERDVLLLPGRTQITIVTGTGPTVFEVAIEGDMESPVAQ